MKLDYHLNFKGHQLPMQAETWVKELENNLTFDLDKIALNLNSSTAQMITDQKSQTTNQDELLFADIKQSQMNENYQVCCQSDLLVSNVRNLKDFVAKTIGNDQSLLLTAEKFQKSINVVDLVTVNSTRTNCFTKK